MIRIGKIVAAHGLQGAVVFTHVVGSSQWLKKEDVLFVELQKGSYIPYFVSQAKASNAEEYIVQLDETDTAEKAKRLVGKHVYVKEELIAKHATHSPLLWIGFKIIDKEKGELGSIEDVMQTTSQWLGKFTYQDKEVLIPLIEQTIEKIDLAKKVIFMQLPEGLLEVYL